MRRPIGVDGGDPVLSRKASSECVYGPYPKPTQVVRLKILRRSGELWLRNSAKCPRNFGRRGALRREGPCGWKRCGVAENRGKRLFIKNTGPCEDVKLMYMD